jgi:phosphatidate phosphatase APP1
LTEAEAEMMSPSELELLEEPLGASAVVTDADGAFKVQFVIYWEDLCIHPKGAPIAFVDTNREHDFTVTAELMPPPPPPGNPHNPTEPQSLPSSLTSLIPTAITSERVPLTYSPVRVISDIDDTVKLSGIQCGLRTAFHNVFVKDLEENLISGMGEWYTEMWRRGVRFHYVVSSRPSAPLTTRKLKS